MNHGIFLRWWGTPNKENNACKVFKVTFVSQNSIHGEEKPQAGWIGILANNTKMDPVHGSSRDPFGGKFSVNQNLGEMPSFGWGTDSRSVVQTPGLRVGTTLEHDKVN